MKKHLTPNMFEGDDQIVEKYWQRNPDAIQETDTKYGRILQSVAYNILFDLQDCEECQNDTYLKIWNSIPSQLAKENKKFVYGLAKEGARAREYEDALLWLKDSGLIRRVGLVSGGRLPLKAFEDLKAFKIYHLDVGLLRVLCEIEPEIILDSEAVFKEVMGALTEQFVLQELQSIEISPTIYYWSENATSEVDYIFSYKNKIIPVEAKAGLVVHAQSLKVFCKKYEPKIAIRTSLKNYHVDNNLINLPLYQLWNTKEVLDNM